jgi:hypothetical protein
LRSGPQGLGQPLPLRRKRQAAPGTCKRIIQRAQQAIIKDKTDNNQYQMIKVRETIQKKELEQALEAMVQ